MSITFRRAINIYLILIYLILIYSNINISNIIWTIKSILCIFAAWIILDIYPKYE